MNEPDPTRDRPLQHCDQEESAPAEPGSNLAPEGGVGELQEVRQKIVESIQTVYDPEIPVNIHELGLIYDVAVDSSGDVRIKMTLTSPACPSAQDLPVMVRQAAELVSGVRQVDVDVVFDPPWSPEKMSEAARLQLGMM